MSDLSPAQMRQITAAVYAVASSRAARGRVFAALRKRFAVASYRDIPAEKLGEVLRYVSAYKQPAPAPRPAPAREARREGPARGALAAFDLVYERLADLVCDASKQWPPEKVTRALDEMANNANILEEWLMRFAR